MLPLKQFQKIARSLSIHKTFSSQETIEFVHENIRLGRSEYKVFTLLLGLANNNNGVAFPSLDWIAEKIEVTKQRASAIVKQLVRKGILFVEKIRLGSSHHNFYIIPTVEHIKAVVEEWFDIVSRLKDKIKSALKVALKKASPVKTSKQTSSSVKPHHDKQTSKTVIRSEVLPSWFEQHKKEFYEDLEKPKEDTRTLEEQRAELEVILATYRKV